jgi:hypothetical protein
MWTMRQRVRKENLTPDDELGVRVSDDSRLTTSDFRVKQVVH